MTSSPLYAQSNGKAEKGVHIVKQLLKKAQDSIEIEIYLYWVIEHHQWNMSPAELLMGRRLRTTIPYTAEQSETETKASTK